MYIIVTTKARNHETPESSNPMYTFDETFCMNFGNKHKHVLCIQGGW